MSCLGENRFSKLKILKNHPYLTIFLIGNIPLKKDGQIRVIFQNFEFWKMIFSKTTHDRYPRVLRKIIWFIPDILSTFPLASDHFLPKPRFLKITWFLSKSGILGGNMLKRGTARGKIIFSEFPYRSHVFSKKRSIHIFTSSETMEKIREIPARAHI